MTVKEHYAVHLASFYEWMSGDFDQKQKEQQQYFEENGIRPKLNKVAVDLGAGHGLQTISLANLGFTVKALDFDQTLLQNLSARVGQLPIELIESDIVNFSIRVPAAELVVCMGDTIAHLNSTAALLQLLQDAFGKLVNQGKLILSYRDYGQELTDIQRFIPVRADKDKILTCVLEYMPDKVRVTDLLYEKQPAGWVQKLSSYYKIRITKDLVEALIIQAGFTILKNESINRMFYLIAIKD